MAAGGSLLGRESPMFCKVQRPRAGEPNQTLSFLSSRCPAASWASSLARPEHCCCHQGYLTDQPHITTHYYAKAVCQILKHSEQDFDFLKHFFCFISTLILMMSSIWEYSTLTIYLCSRDNFQHQLLTHLNSRVSYLQSIMDPTCKKAHRKVMRIIV